MGYVHYFFFLRRRRPPISTLFPYTPLFRSLVPARLSVRLLQSAAWTAAFASAGSRLVALVCRPESENTTRDEDRKSTRLNSSHANISYAVFCLKKKIKNPTCIQTD